MDRREMNWFRIIFCGGAEIVFIKKNTNKDDVERKTEIDLIVWRLNSLSPYR